MSIDFDSESDRNMVRYYRLELAQVKLGIRPCRGTLRALTRLGFITCEHSPKPFYTLTEKAVKLLEGVSP